MEFSNVSLPEVYVSESADFRMFLKWFSESLEHIKYNTENLSDLYDPLRCPSNLLWLLGDTMGFKYDDRLPVSYNRLVLLYFMSMIRNKGSKDGVTLAAQVNLAQFNILDYGKENEILYDRLEDTSIPVNSVQVTPHVDEGYIDIVYFSTEKPIDACIEYVRPLGMYIAEYEGVHFDARMKISVDARLTDITDLDVSIGPTHVGHYSREDYARMQKMHHEDFPEEVDTSHTRKPVWYRNSKYEGNPNRNINPGYRALYSLQLCNSDHVVEALMHPIFGLGYTPTDVEVYDGPTFLPPESDYPKTWNLRYDRASDESQATMFVADYSTLDTSRPQSYTAPIPAVNPIMNQIGDAMSLNVENTKYTEVDDQGNIHIVDK